MKRWYWFGVAVDSAGHVKLRQYHVVQDFLSGLWRVEGWSKGIAGKFWHVTDFRGTYSFEMAVAAARRLVEQWAQAYAFVEEGDFSWARDEAKQQTQAPSGAASPDWWAEVLEVSPGAEAGEVRDAYRTQVRKYHPDSQADGATPDADQFIRVHSAWEYYKAEVA